MVIGMKQKLLIGISLLAVLIIGMISFAPGHQGIVPAQGNGIIEQTSLVPTVESSDVAGRVSHNLVMKSPAKTAMNTVLVYKTLPPIVTNETTLEYARKFNVTGTLKGGAVVQSKDLRFGVEISKKSGRVIYMDQDRPNANQDSPENLPSDEVAIKIATKFLKDRDLFPEDAVEPVAVRENAYTVGKGDKIYYGRIGVWYHRYLNGLKVDGTQLAVYVGGNGDVIDYFANWRKYEPYMEYPIISQQDAFDLLKTKGISVGINEGDATVSIDNASLAYRTKAGAYAEEYLEPVWMFKGNVMVDGNSVQSVEQYIPALTDESVKSLSS
jgi:hypothetical protein